MTIRTKVAAAAATMLTAALLSGTAMAAPKVLMLHQWAIRQRRRGDRQARRDVHRRGRQVGADLDRRSHRQHAGQAARRRRRRQRAARRAAQGPGNRRVERHRQTANLDELAKAEEGWDKVVAPELLPVMKPTGHWVAAPMNIHRINWIWGSNKAHGSRPASPSCPRPGPSSTPTATRPSPPASHLPRALQRRTGPTPRRSRWSSTARTSTCSSKAFVEGDVDAMRSPGMIKAFDQMRLMVSKYMDPGDRRPRLRHRVQHDGQGRGRCSSSWATGRSASSPRPASSRATTILCGQAPTDWGKPGFILNSDSVVFFKQNDPDYVAGPEAARHLIMSPEFQTVFNIRPRARSRRGSTSISAKGFNPCQQQSPEGPAGLDRRRHAGALDGPQHDRPAEVSRRDDGHHHRVREHARR